MAAELKGDSEAKCLEHGMQRVMEAASDVSTRVIRLECGCGVTFDHVKVNDAVRFRDQLWTVEAIDHYAAFDALHLKNIFGSCYTHSYLVECIGEDTLTRRSTLDPYYPRITQNSSDMTLTGPRRYFPPVPSKRESPGEPFSVSYDYDRGGYDQSRLTLVPEDDFNDFEYGVKETRASKKHRRKLEQQAARAPATRPLHTHGISTADLIKNEVKKLEHQETRGESAPSAPSDRKESVSDDLPKPIPKRDGDW